MSAQTNEAHHECGPSTLERVMECPGSVRLSSAEPDVESDDAKEGTFLHMAAAKLILGDELWDEGLTEEQRDNVERCLEFLNEVCPWPPPPLDRQILTETRVNLRDARGTINWGTADVIAITTQKVVIIDWKFGRKIKENALSLQISNYAAAAVQSVPVVRAWSNLPIEAWAFFPRLGVKLMWRADTGEQAIKEVARLVRTVVDAAEQPDAPVNPGSWCEYCRHLPNCDAVRLAAERDIVPAKSDDLVDPRRALKLYDLSLVVEKQAKAVRSQIRDLLLSHPDAIPGLQLRKRQGKRSITDDVEMKARMVGTERLSVLEYIRACSPTVTALEKAYVDKFYNGRGKEKVTKDELKKKFAEIAGDMVKKTDTKVLTRI